MKGKGGKKEEGRGGGGGGLEKKITTYKTKYCALN